MPWRRVCAAIPAVALIVGGMAFSAPAAPAPNINGVAVAGDLPAIVVPDNALTFPLRPGSPSKTFLWQHHRHLYRRC
jgi:hypothetical protein